MGVPSRPILEEGIVHASVAVEAAVEAYRLDFRSWDDNLRRLTSLRILADWCWADDNQWLYSAVDDNQYFSHDHGYYFPGGPDWTPTDLALGTPPRISESAALIPEDPRLAGDVLERLDALSAERIAIILTAIPREWPVTDDELAGLVLFLECRRRAIMGRYGR